MALEIRQSLKLTQSLIMTQKLQQAIKLLQLSRLELEGEIQQVLESNPVLEDTELPGDEKIEDNQAPEVPPISDPEANLETAGENGEAKSSLEEWDWDGFLKDRLMPTPMGEYEEREALPFESLNAEKSTLKSHLIWQLHMAELDEEVEAIGVMIIGNLDLDGYLRATTEEIAAELNIEPARVEEILAVVQGFDPPGVAARSLQECLQLQVKLLGTPDPVVAAIIDHHLNNLGNKNYQAIARDLKISMDKVIRAGEIIMQLEPKPGRGFDSEDTDYINPDVHVEKVGNDYIIRLNDDGLPKLRINSFYLEAMRGPDKLPDGVKSYIQKHLDNALWFIRSIHQRQRTLYKVTESIVRFQRGFLDHGLSHLRPLTLRQVAEDVQMHESTISRVTTNKYVYTPQGVFDLKFFQQRHHYEPRRPNRFGKRQREDPATGAFRKPRKPLERPGDRRPPAPAGRPYRPAHRCQYPRHAGSALLQ